MLGRDGTRTRLNRSTTVQPNGSDFGRTYSFDSTNWLRTSNLLDRVGLLETLVGTVSTMLDSFLLSIMLDSFLLS